MKQKIVMFLVTFALVITFALTANAATIKEDTSTYAGNGDVYIIGSSKFSSNIIITGRMIGVAGAREAVIQYMIYNNWNFDPDDLDIYYYNDLTKTWKKLPQTSEDTIKNLTPEETQQLTENLNIYYENQEEKTVEVPYEVNQKNGYKLVAYTYDSQNNRVEIEYKNGKLQIPATTTYIETYFVNEQDEEDKILLDIIEQDKNNFQESSTTVRTLAELKKAIADKKEDIRLDANILDITETITIPYQVNFNGAGYKLAFKDIQKTSNNPVASGLVIAGDWSYITNLTIEMNAKEGWQGNYGLQVYGAQNVTIENYTGTKADAALLVNGSRVTLMGNINVTGNEFGGMEVSKGTNIQLQNSNLIIDDAKIIMNDETISKPVVWLEKNQGTVNGTTLIPNENIPTVAGKSQVFYYSNAKVFQNVEVSTYEELKFAMNCAEVENVKLLKDIDLTTGIVVSKTIALDLNGKTLTAKNDTEGIGIFKIVTNGNLTINGEGTIDSACQTNDYSMAAWVTEYGKLTINGGTYTNVGAKDFEDDNTTSNNNELIEVRDHAQVTINGGRFIGNTQNATHGAKYTLNFRDADKTTASITVKGGTFVSYNPAASESENPIMNFVAEGYKVVASGDEYTVRDVEENDIVLANGIAYTTLADAFANAKAGTTVELLKDITIPTVVVVNKTVTLDLNGHTIKNETDIWNEETKAWSLISVRQNGDLTITGNGTLKAKENDCYAVDLQEGGKVTINNGRYVGNIDAVYVKEGTATINGGTYSIQQLSNFGDTRYTLNCHDENYRNGIAKIVVKGGSFEEFDPANNVAEGEGTNFLADGLRTELYHGNYTVVENN